MGDLAGFADKRDKFWKSHSPALRPFRPSDHAVGALLATSFSDAMRTLDNRR